MIVKMEKKVKKERKYNYTVFWMNKTVALQSVNCYSSAASNKNTYLFLGNSYKKKNNKKNNG